MADDGLAPPSAPVSRRAATNDGGDSSGEFRSHAPSVCAFESPYRLVVPSTDDGAGENTGGVFHPDWDPILERVAECLESGEVPDGCVTVQGLYGTEPIDAQAASLFGSERAARHAMAREIASRVLSELYLQGIDKERLRELSPPDQPMYRGAEIRIREACVGQKPGELTAVQPPTVADAPVLEDGLSGTAGSLSEPRAAPQGAFLSGALGASGVFGGFGDPISAVLRITGGLHESLFYGRAGLGLGVGSEATHRSAFDLILSGGLAPLPWLEVGAMFFYRIASHEPFGSWHERLFAFGLEAIECLPWPGEAALDICLEQRAGLIGRRYRQAIDLHDGLYQVPEEDEAALTAEVALALRLFL